MSNQKQGPSKGQTKRRNPPPPVNADADGHEEPDDVSAEQVRSESQTAQDRDHTIRGGDDRTAPMKEFPT